jgi:arylsulfatase A-like enzyme
VGCYGSTFYETPNIDRLAKQGMRFTNAYAAGCVCSPTRASIMCGKYPARLHLTDFLTGRSDRPSQKLLRPKAEQKLSLEEISLARALKPAGYVTASIGKWHLGGPDFSPEKHGFDLNIGGSITGSPPGGYFKFKAPNLVARNDDEYLTDRLTEEAEAFIDKNKDNPFFLYLAHYAVHIPLQGKKELIEKYERKTKPAKGQNNAIYAAMVQSSDESVGRLLKKLDELKLADNTVVIFTSDNGGLSVKEGPDTPSTTNEPLRAGKGYLYEGGIREPFIVRWPGVVKPAGVCDVPISSQDLYPTILQLAGAKPAAGQVIDGESIVPLLKQSGKPAREALFWHYPHYSNQGGKPSGAVRQGDNKLIEFYEDGHVELYNLKDDPGEMTDLAKKLPDEAARLQKLLADWRKAVKAQMPTPNPDYKP